MARPRKEIDKVQFEKLCGIQCTQEEIASFFDCSHDTIERWTKKTYGDSFSVVHKKYSAGGKMSLRRYQFELAKKYPAMAIWLGKQYLNQRDNIEISRPNDAKDDPLTQAIKGVLNVTDND
jgi:hypothetical protein